MPDVLAEGQTRIDQHTALHWAWTLLRHREIQESMERIFNTLNRLSDGINVDFEDLIKELEEAEKHE